MVWTKLLAPRSLMAAIGPEAVDAAARDSSLWPRYATEVDRESAREMLAARLAEAAAVHDTDEREEGPEPAPGQARRRSRSSGGGGGERGRAGGGAVVDYLKSREGRSLVNTVARGVFGLLRRRR